MKIADSATLFQCDSAHGFSKVMMAVKWCYWLPNHWSTLYTFEVHPQSPPLSFFLPPSFFVVVVVVVEWNRMWKVKFLSNDTKSRNTLHLSSSASRCLVNERASRQTAHSNCPWNTCEVCIRTWVPTASPLQMSTGLHWSHMGIHILSKV